MVVNYVKERDSAVKAKEHAIHHYKAKKDALDRAVASRDEAIKEQDRLRQVNEELNGNNAMLKKDLNDVQELRRGSLVSRQRLTDENAQLKAESSSLLDRQAQIERELADSKTELAKAHLTLRRWAKNVGQLQEKVEEDLQSLDLTLFILLDSENKNPTTPEKAQVHAPAALHPASNQKPIIPPSHFPDIKPIIKDARAHDLSLDGSPDSKSKSIWFDRCLVCDKSFRNHSDLMSHVRQQGHYAQAIPRSMNKRPYMHEHDDILRERYDTGRIEKRRDPRRRRMD